jgi:hypothetical protein
MDHCHPRGRRYSGRDGTAHGSDEQKVGTTNQALNKSIVIPSTVRERTVSSVRE